MKLGVVRSGQVHNTRRAVHRTMGVFIGMSFEGSPIKTLDSQHVVYSGLTVKPELILTTNALEKTTA